MKIDIDEQLHSPEDEEKSDLMASNLYSAQISGSESGSAS